MDALASELAATSNSLADADSSKAKAALEVLEPTTDGGLTKPC